MTIPIVAIFVVRVSGTAAQPKYGELAVLMLYLLNGIPRHLAGGGWS